MLMVVRTWCCWSEQATGNGEAFVILPNVEPRPDWLVEHTLKRIETMLRRHGILRGGRRNYIGWQ